MTSNERVWEQYAAAWKAPTASEKRALLEAAVSPACVYTDPTVVLEGHDALVEYLLAFHQQVPGGHFVTERFYTHHQRSAARWTMRGAGGEVLGEGISYGEYDDMGRLVRMTGFFDAPGAD